MLLTIHWGILQEIVKRAINQQLSALTSEAPF